MKILDSSVDLYVQQERNKIKNKNNRKVKRR